MFWVDALPLALAEVCAKGMSPGLWAEVLDPYMEEARIVTLPRVACFVAQVAIESAGFSALTENLAYTPERLCAVWPGRFDETTAKACAHNPKAIANRVYADRMGNGGPDSGDGWLFRGAGLIQLTGRENHTKFAKYAKINLDEVGDYMRSPRGAAQSACWFWSTKYLNTLADNWMLTAMSRKINGGDHALPARIAQCNYILKVISK